MPRPRIAWVTLRHQPHYRSDAFANGFEELGFKVNMRFPEPGEVQAQDVVTTWNLNPRYRGASDEAARAGAALIVAENGYMPARAGAEKEWYALALNGHNGSGRWYVGKEDRWTPLGYTLSPWRSNPGGHILVADQRGIGSAIMRCPYHFYESIAPRIKRIFAKVDRKNIPEIRLRTHPGRHQPQRSLEADLKGAQAVVTWASNVANIAVCEGYPSFRVAPYHVNAAVLSDITQLPNPPKTDREDAFRKLAWAQWHVSEISTGEAFRHLLRGVL